MAFGQIITKAVTTDADGAANVYTEPIQYGYLSRIRYVKTDFADTVDFTITTEKTGETLWGEENVTASATRAPRHDTHTSAGVVQDTALCPFLIVDERIHIVIANGGDTKAGTFYFYLS